MSGDFDKIARFMKRTQDVHQTPRLTPGTRLRRRGSGNLSIPAALAGAIVTGSTSHRTRSRQPAATCRCRVWKSSSTKGDAEQMPYPDASFDVVALCSARCLPAARDRRTNCAASVVPAAASQWPTGHRGASSARCSKQRPSM